MTALDLKSRSLKISAFLFVGLLMGSASTAFAQGKVTGKANSLFFELGGNGLVYSINYDRLLTDHLSVRGGIGIFSIDDSFGEGVDVTSIPLLVNYLVGNGNNHLELGIGVLILTGSIDIGSFSDTDSGAIGTGVLGYRHQKQDGGLFFKAGITPLVGFGEFQFWVGASVGYTL